MFGTLRLREPTSTFAAVAVSTALVSQAIRASILIRYHLFAWDVDYSHIHFSDICSLLLHRLCLVLSVDSASAPAIVADY